MQMRMQALQAVLGNRSKITWEVRQYAYPRRFTPAQAKVLLEAELGAGLFGMLRESAGEGWPDLRSALFSALTSQESRWNYGYGFLSLHMTG
jgi:hypothetical protein